MIGNGSAEASYSTRPTSSLSCSRLRSARRSSSVRVCSTVMLPLEFLARRLAIRLANGEQMGQSVERSPQICCTDWSITMTLDQLDRQAAAPARGQPARRRARALAAGRRRPGHRRAPACSAGRAPELVTGYGPQFDLEAAGFPVQALVTLDIAQGRLAEIREFLTSLPGVIEAYATTGTGDVVCRVAARSNADLQQLLIDLDRSEVIRRSTSVVILSTVVVVPGPAPARSTGSS